MVLLASSCISASRGGDVSASSRQAGGRAGAGAGASAALSYRLVDVEAQVCSAVQQEARDMGVPACKPPVRHAEEEMAAAGVQRNSVHAQVEQQCLKHG